MLTRTARRAASLALVALLSSGTLLTLDPAPARAVPASSPVESPASLSAPDGNLVDNGSFELPDVSETYGTPWVQLDDLLLELPDWTITNGAVDVVTEPHWQAPDGDQVLDLDGTVPGFGGASLTQSIPTTLGTAYELGFVYSANVDCGDIGTVSAEVFWNGSSIGVVEHDTKAIEEGHTLAAFDYRAFSAPVVGADESTSLQFRSLSADASTCGIVLDDVYVVHQTSPVWEGTGDGTVLVAGEAPSGPAQFTYDYLDADGTANGAWKVNRVATETAELSIPYRFTGLHAFSEVTVSLSAVVISADGGDTTTPLVEAGPASCDDPGCTGNEPSGGFDYEGVASFSVEPGDLYGFAITGSNTDSNGILRGELVLGTQLPIDCADAQELYGADDDGRYQILPLNGQRFSVHCADMDATASEYLTVPQASSGTNQASYAAGGAATGTTVTTTFEKVRLDPATLSVDIGDLRFATSTGSLSHPDTGGDTTVESMPYATAMGCGSPGAANVDLRGTPFAVDDEFTSNSLGTGGATFSAADQVVDVVANGGCGWVSPNPTAYNPFNPTAGQYELQLRYLTVAAVTLSTPVVFASAAREGTVADIYGLVDGAENDELTVEVRTSDSCVNGGLVEPSLVATKSVTTDAEGYIAVEGIAGIASGDFVTIRITSPPVANTSLCVRTTADNDYWPKALPLGGSTATAQDVVEVEGRSRWYRFPVVPDQRITVSLSNLPADYDLAVFKDIAAEFESQLVPEDAGDLTRLSAEFAPSVFSPSVFSPSVFSPSVFSPDAYSPSVFSPSVFSPSVFSPSVFSPSVFSPSVFSPSVFSPSVFSPSVFSPSVFSPSVFSPSVFSPSVFSEDDIARAFSSAQTRTLIGVSATAGTANETVVVNSWNNVGNFYVRVSGRGGAFDPNELFTLTVQKAASSCTDVSDTTLTPRLDVNPDSVVGNGTLKTIFLTDSSKLALGTGPGSLSAKLQALTARSEVAGTLVDVAGDTRVSELKAQADANTTCPFAVNLVAEEIKAIVDSYRADNPGLRYVAIIGGDTVIPFFRYPDQSLLGQESGYYPPVKSDSISEASLRRDFVLSQDAYGSGVSVSLRTNLFPVPGLAVGRLVETSAEIAGMIDAYTATNGVVSPTSSLVTGYDFLEDAANQVASELQAGTGTVPDTLITPSGVSPQDPASWTATQLRNKFLGSRHDVSFLAGHFSANSALAADFSTSLITTELAASSVNLENALVFSAGCHSGYNLVDSEALDGVALPLDWAQAFARKRAVLIAGTGYQYGDTDFLEYSERLYRDFSRELRRGAAGTPVSVGEALANAKRTYLTTTPDIRGIHEKALLESALFGLPMFGVNMPAGRGNNPATGAAVTPTNVDDGPAGDLGLATHDLELSYDPDASARSLALKNPPYDAVPGTFTTARWLEGPDGVVTNPAEPALPLDAVNVTSTNPSQVLRGVGFRGGTYVDTAPMVPLTGAPTTELRGVHAPFLSPVFYPMKLWTPNYFGALGGNGGTNLLVTPAQHRAFPGEPGQSLQRAYTGLDLRLFYSANLTATALSDAPTIVSVATALEGNDLVFRAHVVGDPKAAIHEVWVTWTDGNGTWQSLDLEQGSDSRIWTGRLADAPANVQFVVQAANGVGLVAFDDNFGRYYGSSGVAPAATSLELVNPPTSGTFGTSTEVTAALAAGSTPLSGKSVTISIGGASAVGTTDPNGHVTVAVPLSSVPADTQIRASFAGDATYLPSGASAPFTIAKTPSTLQLTMPARTLIGGDATAVATLTGGDGPLIQRTVAFLVTAPGSTQPTVSTATTDYLGRARLKLPTAAVGTYAVEVRFGSVVPAGTADSLDLRDPTYGPASRAGSHQVIWPFTGFFSPIDNEPVVNTTSAGSTVPMKFSLGGDRGLAILATGYPRLVKYSCDTGVPEDDVEETSRDSGGLTFDAASGRYLYHLKTLKTHKGGCYRFELKLIDDMTYTVAFRFN